MIYSKILHQLLLQLEPEVAHKIAIKILSKYPNRYCHISPVGNHQKVHAFNLEFPHAIGLAAGFDKNAECYNSMLAYGFGHVEVGTVTPRAQVGNSKPRIFRLKNKKAIINRLGFNNKGIDYLIKQLSNNPTKGIIGINIGKNKNTSLNNALDDYLYCQNKAHSHASYITINISSPNTPNLRQLFESEYLNHLLINLTKNQKRLNDFKQKKVPLLLKLSPDLTEKDLERVIGISLKHKIDGLIATNTTTQRPLDILSKEHGGLSGEPLQDVSLKTLKTIKKLTGEEIDIIACGGINSPKSAQKFLNAGAKLIQIYTGFIYQGPKIIREIINTINAKNNTPQQTNVNV